MLIIFFLEIKKSRCLSNFLNTKPNNIVLFICSGKLSTSTAINVAEMLEQSKLKSAHEIS